MMNNLKIVMIDTDKIKPYHRNVRFNDETVMKLCEIIPKVGFNVPILIDKNNVIIKGHSRWKAGVKLGLSKLPCIISEKAFYQAVDLLKNDGYQNINAMLFDNMRHEILNECEKQKVYDVIIDFLRS